MRILIIRCYPSYLAVTGATYNVQELGLARALVKKGHACDLVFWTEKEEKTVCVPVEGFGTVHVFYRHGRTLFKNTVFTNCDALYQQYDVLQVNEYNQMQSWILAGRYPDKTVIYHGPYACAFNKKYNLMCKVFDRLFLKRYIRLGTKFMAKSELAKAFLLSKGICAENVSVCGVGLDAEALESRSVPSEEPLYQQMEKDESTLKLLYIGRLEKRRNIPFLIDVLQEVKKQTENVKLYIIGDGDPSYVRNCFDYIDQRGVRDAVVWQRKMKQKQLASVYQMADFFLLPTEYEIFGMVLLEAMYYGTVVLTTANGGSNTLIRSGENGFVLEAKDPKEWADLIARCKDQKAETDKIGVNAAQMIAKNFLWDSLCGNFEAMYCMLSGEPGDESK